MKREEFIKEIMSLSDLHLFGKPVIPRIILEYSECVQFSHFRDKCFRKFVSDVMDILRECLNNIDYCSFAYIIGNVPKEFIPIRGFAPIVTHNFSEEELNVQLFAFLSGLLRDSIVRRNVRENKNIYDILVDNTVLELKLIKSRHDIFRFVGQVKEYRKFHPVVGVLYVMRPGLKKEDFNIIDVPSVVLLDKEIIEKKIKKVLHTAFLFRS